MKTQVPDPARIAIHRGLHKNAVIRAEDFEGRSDCYIEGPIEEVDAQRNRIKIRIVRDYYQGEACDPRDLFGFVPIVLLRDWPGRITKLPSRGRRAWSRLGNDFEVKCPCGSNQVSVIEDLDRFLRSVYCEDCKESWEYDLRPMPETTRQRLASGLSK